MTISKAGQNLFALADAAARGEKVEFVHKGNTIKLVAEKKPSKLARLGQIEPLFSLPPGVTWESVEEDWSKVKLEMQEDWERKNL